MVHEKLVLNTVETLTPGMLLMCEPEDAENQHTYLVKVLKVGPTDSIGVWEITYLFPVSKGTSGDRYLILDPRHQENNMTTVKVRVNLDGYIVHWWGPRLFSLTDQEIRFVELLKPRSVS